MTPEDQQAVANYAREIAKLLHRNTPPEAITTLEAVEKTVRGQILEYVSPEIAIFLSNKARVSTEADNAE